jgi:hypothetical protein
MSGIIHLVNQTPISSYCKKQKTVETATYGSEFMVASHSCEQIIDLRYTLRMMGIPIDGPAWAFGDNASVITASTIPQSTFINGTMLCLTIVFVKVLLPRSCILYM